jgi:GNAT superfamily N-acetyltransferase
MMANYWTKSENLARVVCRPALPMDTLEVMEFTKKIWEGEDYIPLVWEMWLNDSEGLLAVAENGGRVVGLSKLTRLSPEDWWLEGLRVDPDFEGRGIASHLHNYMLETWLRFGKGALRLVTSSKREPVHHLCRKTGFSKTCEFVSYSALSMDEAGDHFTRVDEKDVDQAFEVIINSPILPLFCGLLDRYWSWSKPQKAVVVEAVQRGHAWWWGEQRGLLLFWEDDEEEEKYIKIQSLACPLEDLQECLQDTRKFTRRLGFQKVEWIASIHHDLIIALQSAGFENKWDMTLFMFEKEWSLNI